MVLNVRSVLLLAAAAFVPVVTANAQAISPAKVAIINAQKAVADTQEIKKAQNIAIAPKARYGLTTRSVSERR